MSAQDNSGPAFPCPDLGDVHFSDRSAYPGMTLLDYFAAHATEIDIQSHLSYLSSREEARFAYARAMLKARQS